jgi:hypothetical protein
MENCRSSPYVWATFSHGKCRVLHNFGKKWVRFHFGRFFLKLIWSLSGRVTRSQSYVRELQRQRCKILVVVNSEVVGFAPDAFVKKNTENVGQPIFVNINA